MLSLYYNPSVTLPRATSLYTREAFNKRFANASPGETELAKAFSLAERLTSGGGRCTVTNQCSDNLPYGHGCSQIPGGDLQTLQRRRGFSLFAPARSLKNLNLPPKELPRRRPPGVPYLQYSTRKSGGLAPGKFSQGEAWRGLPLRKRRPLQGLLQRWES